MTESGKNVAKVVIGGIVSFLAGAYFNGRLEKPAAVYVRDLGGDMRPEVVVENYAGQRSVFIEDRNFEGNYIPLAEYTRQMDQVNEALEQKIEKAAENIGK